MVPRVGWCRRLYAVSSLGASSWISSASGGLASCCFISTSASILAGHCPWRLEWSLLGHPGVASTTRCPSTSAAVHRYCALRSRWRVAFSASLAAHRCRRSNSAIRRSSFAPVMLLDMLLLRCLLSVRDVLHDGPDDVCMDILGWPRQHAALRPRRRYTGAAPFGLGGLLSFGFAGDTGTNSAVRRSSFVPVMFHCELLFWCPYFSP